METKRLWTPAFINYGISSGIFYMTQYVLVAALPIVLTSDLEGSAVDAGLAMTYFQIGTILCRPFAGRLIDGFDKRYILLLSTALFFIIMGLFNFTASLNTIFVLRGLHGIVFALATTVMAALAVLVLPNERKGGRHQYVCCFLKCGNGFRAGYWFICVTELWKLCTI